MQSLFEHVRHYRHVIWDWNGTLLDDVELCHGIISELLEEHELPSMTVTEYRKVFGFPVIDYYRRIGLDESRAPFEVVATEFITRYNRRMSECALHDGVRELLTDLNSRGIRSSILTASKESDVMPLLRQLDILNLFAHVHGLQDHYAVSKIERGRDLITKLELSPKDVLLIGDTDHDAEVAAALGVDALLVADGHQSSDRWRELSVKVLESRYAGRSEPKA